MLRLRVWARVRIVMLVLLVLLVLLLLLPRNWLLRPKRHCSTYQVAEPLGRLHLAKHPQYPVRHKVQHFDAHHRRENEKVA